eukprot:scaffold4360_cov73-Phaeocystis_antarctica.AAC.5
MADADRSGQKMIRSEVHSEAECLRTKRDQGTIFVRTATSSASTHADVTPGAAAGLPSAAHMLKQAPSTIVRAA